MNERESTEKFKGKLSYPWAVENCSRFVSLLSLLCIYIFTFLLLNMYKWEMIAVFQLFAIIIMDVGYTSFHFAFISDFTYKSFCSISPESLIILNVILTYKITEVILEGGFAFVFYRREGKYTHMLKCNLNTCMKVVEEPVINLEHYLGSSHATLS